MMLECHSEMAHNEKRANVLQLMLYAQCLCNEQFICARIISHLKMELHGNS